MQTIYSQGGKEVPRLQSFSDEAGTFAFALLPSALWSAYRGRFLYVGVMAIALALTWSVGAIGVGLLVLVGYLLRDLLKRNLVLVFLIVAAAVVAAVFVLYYSSAIE